MVGEAVRKELLLVLRDRGALATLFVMPVVFIAFFGFVFGDSDDRDPTKLALYAASGPAAGRVVAALEASAQFELRRVDDVARVDELVAERAVTAGVVVPADVDPGAGRPVRLVINSDTPPQVRGPVEGAVRAILDVALLGERPAVVAVVSPHAAEPSPRVSAFQVSVPGTSVLFCFFIAVTVAIAFIEERKQGTWRRLMAAPVRRPVVLVAKLVPYFVVGLLQMAFLFGVGAGVFGMAITGSALAVVLVTMATVYCAVGLALFIASFGGSEKQVGSIASVVILVLGMVGGCMVPRLVMPPVMQSVGLATPHGWSLDAYYAVLIHGGGVAEVALPIGVLLGYGTVLIAVGAARFRF